LSVQDYKTSEIHASFEAFTAVMFQVEVFWVVIPFSVVAGYQLPPWQHDSLKRWYPNHYTTLHYTTLSTLKYMTQLRSS